ncbi:MULTISPECIES: lysozyme inhibitor LprI family protein [Nostoc]|uniref:Lysozyme inhibitor LprI family protein n=1 Tax=Nostoc paludosum FACHB-159 TaxID=2692908 RepID=A0ABR8KHD2_9NOSO|nr:MULTISPECIES: lysozyme inhibitor LprI family protein [Nostoc]MBD2682147.1 lysozyme inhibitor LprI family protein [Nostoc sp. FACHB-857]MBD2738475.1 lysozyme inhibitor LprI family protein [Nostoc paludosum FACHB-159]
MYYLFPLLVNLLAFSSSYTPSLTAASTTPDLPKMHLAQKLNCNNPQTQVEINQCSNLSYQNADKKLNAAYQKLVPKLDRTRKQKLIAAQQAWIKFRDASCEFERSEYEGGTIAPSIYLGCLENLTKERTQQLQEYLKSDY